jgi:D-alanyl-D-alanine carboxypeptidase (penicillin-binding protein 5/6)
VAVAEFLSGSEKIFSDEMNRHAKLLGLDSTNYVNSHGLPDPGHYTTARDLARLSVALMRNFSEHYSIYKKRDFTYNNIRQYNRNTLLVNDPSVDGLKTGYTKEAGYCLVASAEREGMRLVSVVLGATTAVSRMRGTRLLLNYGFSFFETISRFSVGSELALSRVWQGDSDFLSAGVSVPVYLTVPRGASEDIETRVTVNKEILAPIAIGDRVGTVSLILHGEMLHEAPLTAREDIFRADFFSRFGDRILMWLNSVFSAAQSS